MEITFKKADKTDVELIHNLAEQIFPVTYSEIITPEQNDFMMDWMYSVPNLLKQMDEGHTYYLAYADGVPVGYVSVEQDGPDMFHLQKIYVLPAYQKHHLGRHLFEKAIAHIKEVHPAPCRMVLNVNRNNTRALGFYEYMGMKKISEGDFDIGNGFFMTDYIMGLDI